ncbi:HIG1 domain family member 2A, mitochondrial [Puntigrus tetrazona]|uniref:HIG1 domain family member 2A, mitochondrial n=1 Tax=Puntigrus tetrazona TaxID=1606681 RepID=UPI001C8974FE|nr:HIG1 domain family member 2A, mitochondrial [Puntigrus tetrazona]
MPCSRCLFHFLLAEVLSMATATTPVGQDRPTKVDRPPVVFDLSQPPVIEGFTPLPRAKEENFKEKFIRKTKENPLVPIGCLGTAGALVYGLSAFRQGKTRQSQLLMRARIFAQGFTVVAIIVGVAVTALKPKQ